MKGGAHIYFEKEITKENIEMFRLERAEYEKCEFRGCDFTDRELGGTLFMDCRFVNCNFTSATVVDSALRNIFFSGCKMLGFRFDRCDPKGMKVSFEDCMLDYSLFSSLKLSKTRFIRCSLRDADFTETDLRNSVFEETDLTRTIFRHTDLAGSDLRTAWNFDIDAGVNKIRGVFVSILALPGFLLRHDLHIE